MKVTPIKLLITLLAAAVILPSCRPQKEPTMPDRKTELAAIEQSIRGTIGWAKDKDFKLLFSIIANDPEYLEVQPGNK
ncbi:MAG: hypothetical protein ACYDEQ_10060, partial [Desulfocucumaceae bacterium]